MTILNDQLTTSFVLTILSIFLAFTLLVITILLLVISIQVASSVFKKFGFTITDKKQIKESDAISYFLQALIAVVIAFYAINK